MSLYNLIHGTNPMADTLLSLLNLDRGDVGRFRDAFLSIDEPSNEPRICVYTRNGGGNREEYQDVLDALAMHPLYVCDYDDDFDCTYATIEFRAPDAVRESLRKLCENAPTKTPEERWREALAHLHSAPADDPTVKRLTEAFAPVFEAIDAKTKTDA